MNTNESQPAELSGTTTESSDSQLQELNSMRDLQSAPLSNVLKSTLTHSVEDASRPITLTSIVNTANKSEVSPESRQDTINRYFVLVDDIEKKARMHQRRARRREGSETHTKRREETMGESQKVTEEPSREVENSNETGGPNAEEGTVPRELSRNRSYPPGQSTESLTSLSNRWVSEPLRDPLDGELNGTQMQAWLESRGMENEHSAPHTSAHIRKVKQMHRTLMRKARAIRIDAKCLEFLWDEFYMTAAHLHMKTPTKSLNGKTPYKMWFECKPDYFYMHKIGCHAFVLIPTHNPKIQLRSIETVLIGYGQSSKMYRCWDRQNLKVYQLYHIMFIEHHKTSAKINERIDDKSLLLTEPLIPTLQQLDDSALTSPQSNVDDLSYLDINIEAPAPPSTLKR